MAVSKKKPKHVPWRKLFSWGDNKLLIIIFGVIYLWVFFFIPDPLIEWVVVRLDAAKSTGGHFFSLITSGTIVLLFGRFLVGNPLRYGKSKASIYFNGELPSNKISEKFNIDPAQASKYFLSYYDCWQFDSEPQHDLYLETTRVRYACLFDYFMKRLALVLLFLGFLILLLNITYFKIPTLVIAGQGSILFIITVFMIIIFSANKLPSKQKKDPTGCWAEWRCRCEENYMEFLTALDHKTLTDFHEEMRNKLDDLKKIALS